MCEGIQPRHGNQLVTSKKHQNKIKNQPKYLKVSTGREYQSPPKSYP